MDRINTVEQTIEGKIVGHKNKISDILKESYDKRKMLAYLSRRN